LTLPGGGVGGGLLDSSHSRLGKHAADSIEASEGKPFGTRPTENNDLPFENGGDSPTLGHPPIRDNE